MPNKSFCLLNTMRFYSLRRGYVRMNYAYSCRNNSTLRSTLSGFISSLQSQQQSSATEPLYEGHIPTSLVQRTVLSVGSSILALTAPSRGDMVAVNGESSGFYALRKMRQKMLNDDEGLLILKEMPIINSNTINIEELSRYPEGSLGKEYTRFLEKNKVSPDTRLPVRFVDDPELAYVMLRYRQTHDLVHTLLGMPTNMLGEVAVKWVEGLQTALPMCIGGAILGPVRLKPKNRAAYLSVYLPWAVRVGTQSRFLMNVYFEKRWHQDVVQLRAELGIEPPPGLSTIS